MNNFWSLCMLIVMLCARTKAVIPIILYLCTLLYLVWFRHNFSEWHLWIWKSVDRSLTCLVFWHIRSLCMSSTCAPSEALYFSSKNRDDLLACTANTNAINSCKIVLCLYEEQLKIIFSTIIKFYIIWAEYWS